MNFFGLAGRGMETNQDRGVSGSSLALWLSCCQANQTDEIGEAHRKTGGLSVLSNGTAMVIFHFYFLNTRFIPG